MTTFWIIAAALALGAALFVAVPLWQRAAPRAARAAGGDARLAVYREQMAELAEDRRSGRLAEVEYAQASAELERRLVDEMPESDHAAATPSVSPPASRAAAVLAMMLLPLSGLFLYTMLGHPDALRASPEGTHGLGQQQLDSMVERLATRLAKNPQDVNGWVMLARAQSVLGRFDQASAAYEHAVQLQSGDAQLLADYADALAMAQGGHLPGKPELLVQQALQADPQNAKALALAGSVAFEKKEYGMAVSYWERLRRAVPPDSEFAASVDRNIEEARSLGGAAGQLAAPGAARASLRRPAAGTTR